MNLQVVGQRKGWSMTDWTSGRATSPRGHRSGEVAPGHTLVSTLSRTRKERKWDRWETNLEEVSVIVWLSDCKPHLFGKTDKERSGSNFPTLARVQQKLSLVYRRPTTNRPGRQLVFYTSSYRVIFVLSAAKSIRLRIVSANSWFLIKILGSLSAKIVTLTLSL